LDPRQQLIALLKHQHDPLRRLVVADQLAQALRVLLRELALEAHDAGRTWDDIGNALGVSRAAAHERFQSGSHQSITTHPQGSMSVVPGGPRTASPTSRGWNIVIGSQRTLPSLTGHVAPWLRFLRQACRG